MINASHPAFTSSLGSAARLSDHDLLHATARAVAFERHATAELLALLAEVDSRRLYLGEGCSSLFTYCVQVLHRSEPAAYSRITAARVARRFPLLLDRLTEGDLTLSSVTLLAAHLTDENHEALLDAARHASKRDVDRLVASLCVQPDIPASVRRLPQPAASPTGAPASLTLASAAPASVTDEGPKPAGPVPPAPPARPATVAPLAADRYLLRVTISADTHARLNRARDLLRHAVPNGDPAAILDRALTLLVEHLERRKAGRVSRPRRPERRAPESRGRHIRAAVRREVWIRDDGRCAVIGSHGRCGETGFLEYHHLVPFARGGATNAANLELRCRAHNAYAASRDFGEAPQTGRHARV
jgi:5-methylcytosine-specific restriction endonuclease McrA